MRILPLVGYNSIKALHAFQALILGLKMLPINLDKTFPEYSFDFNEKTDAEKETMLRQAVAFVDLSKDEIESILSFATDPNGIPYSKISLAQMKLETIFEIIVQVCLEIGRIEIRLVSEEEKKK